MYAIPRPRFPTNCSHMTARGVHQGTWSSSRVATRRVRPFPVPAISPCNTVRFYPASPRAYLPIGLSCLTSPVQQRVAVVMRSRYRVRLSAGEVCKTFHSGVLRSGSAQPAWRMGEPRLLRPHWPSWAPAPLQPRQSRQALADTRVGSI